MWVAACTPKLQETSTWYVWFRGVVRNHSQLTRGQLINVGLKRMFNLDASTAEKRVVNVDDIYLILHRHWVVDTATFPDGR